MKQVGTAPAEAFATTQLGIVIALTVIMELLVATKWRICFPRGLHVDSKQEKLWWIMFKCEGIVEYWKYKRNKRILFIKNNVSKRIVDLERDGR